MSNIHQEETLGKAYDSKLMKRLLSYAKPYWLFILISIFLLVLVTGTELARPYIIKVAIDDNIKGYTQPMYVFDEGQSPIEGIEFNGKVYVRENTLSEDQNILYKNQEKKIMIEKDDQYYLVNGVMEINKKNLDVIEDNGQYRVRSEGETLSAIKLSRSDYMTFREEDIKGLSQLGILFLILITVGFVINYIQVYLLNYTSNKIIVSIRQEVFSHLQKLSLSYFDKNPVGRLVTRVANDTETLNEMYTNVLVNLFKDIFMLVGIIVIMLKMNYKLALLSFTVIPIILFASAIFRIKIRKVYRMVRVRLARINSTLNENITGMQTVHIFKKERKKFNEFDDINKDYLEATKKEIRIYALFRPAIEIIRSLGIALLLWYGGRNVITNVFEFGVLYAFINYLQDFFRPIMELTQKYNILQSAMASSERIFQILDTEEDVKNPDPLLPLTKIHGKIEFKNVWFAYEEENWVLKDVSFSIEPGDSVAFVGATGAGKSSIISLINRFYDIQKGEILIDGKNIKAIDKYELRKRIGIVLQDVFLFTGNIMDNISLGNEDISEVNVKHAAEFVNADNFIGKLPQHYHQPVMERGATLSTGQKQLLSFARALAFKPDILVLDEATSNIDTETEGLIQDALLKLIKGRTSIAVAHRLSTIQHSDKIIVLHKGKIREIGNHQELLEKGGIYYDLYTLQYKDSLKGN